MIKNKKILLFLISFVMIIILSACDISNTTSNIPEETGTTSSETVPYVVEHYKQNIDGSYSTTPSDIDNLTGTPNTLTNGKVNTYEGFSSPSITQENIKGDGTTVIKLYYQRKSYNVSVNNYNAGSISGLGTYKYGENVNIQITPFMGYEYEGIYINDTFITKELSYEINNISSDVEIRFEIAKELQQFDFTSTVDTLTITGIKDKTITSITIPNNVTSIGKGAFEYCSSLTSITIPNSVISIGADAFSGCSALTSITIPNSVTSIGNRAFSFCSALTSITIPNSVTSIGYYAFSDCSSLTSITIPNRVTSIGHAAFSRCSSLTSIMIPNSVTSIEDGAFYNCSALTSITIPNSVTSIEDEAFEGCYRLVEVINKSSISMTLGSIENGYVAYYAKQIIKDESSSKLITNSSGYVTYNDGEDIWLINYVGTDTNIIIPNFITKINTYAFEDCSSLTRITIPNSVTSIGDRAFSRCSSLTSITIPNSVTSIGYSAFYGCRSLTNITISNSVTSIEDSAFSGCSSLANITIPNSVTSIGDYAFYDCSSLTNIYYKGTQEEWNLITIASSNSSLNTSTICFYSEEEPQNVGNYWHYVDGVKVKW